MPPVPSKRVTAGLLAQYSLPLRAERGKDSRGIIFAVGGSPQMPGAIVLTATAALRAGAGKAQIATSRSVAPLVGIAIPEAYVLGVDETAKGGIAATASAAIVERAEHADAVVVGPGIADEGGSIEAIAGILERVQGAVVLDAAALAVLAARPSAVEPLVNRCVITPHCGEMAMVLGRPRETIEESMPDVAAEAASRFGAVVALKHHDTYIATPAGERFCFRGGTVGLATSGSGDTLAGLIGGFLARGCSPIQATLWGVYAHAAAGEALMQRIGLGFLAREVLAEIPGVLRRAGAPQSSS